MCTDSLTRWVLGISGFAETGVGGAERHRVTAAEAPREFFIF